MIKEKKFDSKKISTKDVYMKDGIPCGDVEGKGERGYVAGSGTVGGASGFAANNKFSNTDPDIGKQDISAVTMASTNKTNVKDSVLNTKENPTWGGIITPQSMPANNKIGN